MKLDVSILIADATIATNYENLHDAIATNFFAANLINSSINSASNSNNSIVPNVSINAKKVLSAEITVYDDNSTRNKLANVVASYSEF